MGCSDTYPGPLLPVHAHDDIRWLVEVPQDDRLNGFTDIEAHPETVDGMGLEVRTPQPGHIQMGESLVD